MKFNDLALANKMKHLDKILDHMDLLHTVLKRNIGGEYNILHLPRVWEPGGGSTLFIVTQNEHKYILKVKHKSVLVESKLEQESCFMKISSLENEYNMLQAVHMLGDFVPSIIFWDEEEDIQFLATEYLAFSLHERLAQANLADLFKLWNSIYENVRKLYLSGIVHSDLHENNIRCRSMDSEDLLLIDLEDSRRLDQNEDFENSLDYKGFNEKSSLGKFPYCDKQPYSIKYNCLLRLKEIFKEYIAVKVNELVKECNYDSANGICISIDHGKSEETYQPIHNKYIHTSGQRTGEDKRIFLVKELCNILFKENFSFVDVGSNNGLFCREVSKAFKGKARCIGFEGFAKFNELARALAFLEDCNNIEYLDFLCGEDDIHIADIKEPCFMTICSVWHHIQKKDNFLKQLQNTAIDYIFLEMAVQEECYGGHSWEAEINDIISKLNFEFFKILGYSADYHRPLILISKKNITNQQAKEIDKITKKIFSSRRKGGLLDLISHFISGL